MLERIRNHRPHGAKIKISKTMETRIADMIRMGYTQSEILSRFDISSATVTKICQKYSVVEE